MTMTTDQNTRYSGTKSVEYGVRGLIQEWADDGVKRFRTTRVVEELDHPEIATGQQIQPIMASVERDGLIEPVSRRPTNSTQYRITIDTEPEIPERFVRERCKALTQSAERRCLKHSVPGFELCHQHLPRRDHVETIDEDGDQTEEESDA